MTEGRALFLAAGLHLLLLLGLSLGLANHIPRFDAEPDVTPVEFVDIADMAQITKPPEPSMEAAPRDAGAPAEAETIAPVPPTPVPPAPPEPQVKADDTAPQDAIAEEIRKAAPPKTAPQKAKAKEFDAGSMAALIDKSKPDAPVKPRDTSKFAKSIEQALPKQSRISPIQAATLEQAIRAQIMACWSPPTGGADVQNMAVRLKFRLKLDGSIAAPPEFVSQTGATAGNQAYAQAFVDSARRAILRCTPLELPQEHYAHWQEITLNFDPRLLT